MGLPFEDFEVFMYVSRRHNLECCDENDRLNEPNIILKCQKMNIYLNDNNLIRIKVIN